MGDTNDTTISTGGNTSTATMNGNHSSASGALPAGGLPGGRGAGLCGGSRQEEGSLKLELSTEGRVVEAFNTIRFFEETHCLNLQASGCSCVGPRALWGVVL